MINKSLCLQGSLFDVFVGQFRSFFSGEISHTPAIDPYIVKCRL